MPAKKKATSKATESGGGTGGNGLVHLCHTCENFFKRGVSIPKQGVSYVEKNCIPLALQPDAIGGKIHVVVECSHYDEKKK